jgi:hypothetical protein
MNLLRNTDRREPVLRLQERDLDLLAELFYYGCMSRQQIQALYFGSKPRTNARLRKLYDAGLVHRALLPCSVIGAVSAPLVYLPAPASASLIAGRIDRDPDEIRDMLRKGSPSYLQHTLRIVDFRLQLEEALEERAGAHLLTFLPERRCQHAYEAREVRTDGKAAPWKTMVYKPDAVFAMDLSGHPSAFAVEIDLGHTSASEFENKLAIHSHYRRSGQFAARYCLDKTATLIVTVSGTRRDNLKSLAERLRHLHTGFTTFDALEYPGILAPIWHRPGFYGLGSLLEWEEATPCSV